MEWKKDISVRRMVKDLGVEIMAEPKDRDYFVDNSDINRPGIQLAGFYEHFPRERIQVMGKVEFAYLMSLSERTQREVLDKFFSYEIPALFVTRGMRPTSLFVESAKTNNRYLLCSELPTTMFINKLVTYMNQIIAPKEVMHAVLVDVDGIGILIKGASGVGKSETALELIRRGHRLIADDVVEIKKLEDGVLVGQAPKLTKNLMEIRGIGLLDIQKLFGMGAVKSSKVIDMVVYLENWQEGKYYDRLGIDTEYEKIFDVPLEKNVVPVRPGRNLAIIIEIAARNFRQKMLGYNVAQEFNDKLFKKTSKEEGM
ncbi:HPr(Ser) kinase/phosphatase [Filifactor villosus]|uniref:HPr kinase/phosphorylase n=1 Tax=Filifactor villosus TaxID=29374 RepID=A0ABV9QL50_9FIRM